MIHRGPSIVPLIDRLIDRLRDEYAALPRLRLTPAQVRRLCGVDDVRLCEAVLAAMVEVGFLERNSDGMYIRGRSDLTARGVIGPFTSVQ
jgi:hypothetical protein